MWPFLYMPCNYTQIQKQPNLKLKTKDRLVIQFGNWKAGKAYWRGRLSTVDLLVLTSLDQLLFILKILFTYVTKQAATLMRRSTVLSLPLQLVFPVKGLSKYMGTIYLLSVRITDCVYPCLYSIIVKVLSLLIWYYSKNV